MIFNASLHFARRQIFFGCVVVAALALCSGCAVQSAQRNLDLFVQQAPLPTLVARAEVMPTAERMAAAHQGDFVLHGMGRSMEPVYVAGTAVVVHPTAFHMLRKGMSVVYANRRGVYVAHMLVEKTAAGWRAVGLNNADFDAELVTAKNLVGIVKRAYAPADIEFRPDIAAQIALRSALAESEPLALFH